MTGYRLRPKPSKPKRLPRYHKPSTMSGKTDAELDELERRSRVRVRA